MVPDTVSPNMKDIVEAALEHQKSVDDSDHQDTNEFGDPHVSVIGYGDIGAQIIQHGWDRRYVDSEYPHVETHHLQRGEELPSEPRDADYAILVGDSADEELAVEIGDALPDEQRVLPFQSKPQRLQ